MTTPNVCEHCGSSGHSSAYHERVVWPESMPHTHAFTVPVEWQEREREDHRRATYMQATVTVLRCSGCNEEVRRG